MNGSQFRTILWLRWRLSRNQIQRGGTLNAILTTIFLVAGACAAVAGAVGGLLGGLLGLARAEAWVTLVVWDAVVAAFLFFWAMSILVEIQRSETIDFSRLMHLPVSLRQIFFINYLASHFTPVLVLTLPGMVGLSLGMALGRGPRLLLMVPLVLGFVFMITAWTYCLRGWLVALMVNKRRRRAIIVGMTMAIILLAQLPNLYFNVFHRPGRRVPTSISSREERTRPEPSRLLFDRGVVRAHQWVPFLWLPNGALGLARGRTWPALYGAGGAFLLGALGLMRAYRGTLRFYQGNGRVKSAAPKLERKEGSIRKKSWLERTVPLLPKEAGVLTLTFLRSLVRAPETKMVLLMPFVMVLVFGSMLLRKSGPYPQVFQAFIPTGLSCFILFGLIQLVSNQFGFDRSGFRALVLLPVRRDYVLLAKNTSLFLIGLPLQMALLLALLLAVRLPWHGVLGGLFQFLSGYLLLCLVGNWASILAPYRIAAGSLKPTKTGPRVSLVLFGLHLLFPLAMVPVFIPPALQALQQTLEFWKRVPLGLVASALMLGAVAILYGTLLRGQGRLLQRREKEILDVVTREVE
jgi:ABC-2 type transport system permease protein